MILGQSIPSFFATLLYLTAAILAANGAHMAALHFRPARETRRWVFITVVFLALVVVRHFDIEEHARAALRGDLAAAGKYQGRRAFQAPLAAGALIGGAAALVLMALRGSRGAMRNPLGRVLMMADAAILAMLGLVGVRMISFHALDMMLYRGPHLNWLVDTSATFACGVAAVAYTRLLRHAPQRR